LNNLFLPNRESAKAINNLNNSSRDASALAAILTQLGLDAGLVEAFCKVYIFFLS
jgi:hypothetical protein